MVIRWTFYDPLIDETYTFALNPSEGGPNQVEKPLSIQPTVGAGGRHIVFEGSAPPQTFSWKGVLLTEAAVTAFQTWYARRHQVQLTDDLDRQWWVYLTRLTLTRKRSVSHVWLHEYEMAAIELNWPT